MVKRQRYDGGMWGWKRDPLSVWIPRSEQQQFRRRRRQEPQLHNSTPEQSIIVDNNIPLITTEPPPLTAPLPLPLTVPVLPEPQQIPFEVVETVPEEPPLVEPPPPQPRPPPPKKNERITITIAPKAIASPAPATTTATPAKIVNRNDRSNNNKSKKKTSVNSSIATTVTAIPITAIPLTAIPVAAVPIAAAAVTAKNKNKKKNSSSSSSTTTTPIRKKKEPTEGKKMKIAPSTSFGPTPKPTDIVCQRNNMSVRNHVGNIRYEALIQARSVEYQATDDRSQRLEIVRRVLSEIEDSGMRFVSFNGKSGLYEPMKNTTSIRQKISHALRVKKQEPTPSKSKSTIAIKRVRAKGNVRSAAAAPTVANANAADNAKTKKIKPTNSTQNQPTAPSKSTPTPAVPSKATPKVLVKSKAKPMPMKPKSLVPIKSKPPVPIKTKKHSARQLPLKRNQPLSTPVVTPSKATSTPPTTTMMVVEESPKAPLAIISGDESSADDHDMNNDDQAVPLPVESLLRQNTLTTVNMDDAASVSTIEDVGTFSWDEHFQRAKRSTVRFDLGQITIAKGACKNKQDLTMSWWSKEELKSFRMAAAQSESSEVASGPSNANAMMDHPSANDWYFSAEDAFSSIVDDDTDDDTDMALLPENIGSTLAALQHPGELPPCPTYNTTGHLTFTF